MIDLSFLTEAEQEAILKVLNRDAELKKAEEERVKHLQDVVDDESEYKYKSGQWFYEAKSKRHRDKIHGAELVRASIRKRKKPTTLELYGVMEAPDEAEEDIMVKKQEGNQSSKKVSFPSEEKEQDKLRNGTLAPPKPRLNPFNAEGLQDEPDYHNEDPSPNPEYLMNGTGKPKSGVEPIYSVVKKSPAASAPSQEQDFDLDDALMEPRFPGQRGKTQNIYINEKPLEFGKSYSGGGKIAFESKYPSKKEKESYRISSEELIPERSIITESSHRTMEDKPVIINQDDKPAESVAFWRKPIILGNQEPTQSSVDLPDEQKTSTHILKVSPGADKVEDTFGKSDPENLTSKTAPGEDNKETKYKSTFHNRFEAEHKPVGLPSNIPVVQNRFESSRTDGPLDRSLEKKGRKEDLPKSSHFKVMSLKERMNDMPREQMSNPSQFQSLKHFWNVEEKNPHRETAVTSPDKILAHVSSRNKPTGTDFKQRSSEIPADDVLLPSVSDSLSEEEQTSQKVATWLAKTPTVYGVGQMDPDDQAYSVEEIVEDVQQSPPPKKPDNESVSARQNLREEALEVPKNTEIARSRTEEIRMMPQVDPYSNARKQTTITVSPMSQKSVETKAPALNPNPSDSGFYNRVLQMSNKQSPAKEIVIAEPRREPLQESKPKTVAPENSASEFTISFEKFNNGMSNEAAKKKESSLPNKESMAEEQIEKSVVPKGQDQQDFISALKRLEIEASKPPPLPDVEAEYQDKLLEEEISQNAVSPVKSSRMNFVNFVPASEPNDLDTSTDRSVEFQMQHSDVLNKEPATEETIERSTVPSKNENEDFSIALRKLELEATEHQPDGKDTVGINQKVEFEKPELQVALQTNLPPEAGETLVEEPPIKSTRVASQENAADFHKRLLQLEEQAKIVEETEESRSDISYSSSQDNGDDLAQQPEVSYGLRYTPDVFDGQGKLPVAEEPPIKSTRVESQENAADFHNRLLQLEEQAKIPEEQAKIPEEPEKFHSDINDSFSGGEDMAQLPKVSYGLRSTPDVFEEELPVVEEPPIESTRVESQENAADFHNRLLQLEEQAKIPEEPEDLLDESVKVSQFPNREVFISKKVYSSMESMHSSADSESGKAKEKEVGSQSKPKDFSDLQSYDYSRNEELANPPSPKTPGSYPDNGDILYTKPEVGSPEVLNSKPGMDESNPILRALRRSEAKPLNYKAVQEVSPTSTNPLNSSSLTEDAPVNSFPQNAETLKRLSQSVPAFIQDETDGRDTDSASESSFQIGRHKKSPSSLTNLSGSSGMASMSSVSGSVMSIYSGDFGNVDVKGDIEFSVEYMDELKQLLIYVYQCRDLAAADVKKQRSDPYVKAYLLPEKAKMGKRKTAVKKKSLNPVYNEILKYKIPKQSAVAQTLNLSVWHHDALGRNSFLGEVNLNLGTWDWSNKQRRWYPLEPRTPAAGMGLENRGEMKLSLKYVPESPTGQGTKPSLTGEVYIWIKDCVQLPMLRDNKINSFVKCTVLPDTSRKSRQKTRTVDKTPSPIFNHTMVYDGFKEADLREACVELTVWDHNRLSNHFLGGLRIGLGTGKSYGTAVDWMDSTHEESAMWEKMMASPNTWVDGLLPLRMFKMAKLTK